MLILKGPSDVPGLNLWFDASDASTINNGRISNNQAVFSFTDKINNVNLRNFSLTGPSYSFGVVNGNNAIYFPFFGVPGVSGVTDTVTGGMSRYSLTASNVTQLATATCSMFLVIKPTGIYKENTASNQKWPLTIWDNAISNYMRVNIGSSVPGGYPTRGFRLGDSAGGGVSKRANPSLAYIDAKQDITFTTNGYQSTLTFTEDIFGRAQEKGLTSCLNKVVIAGARLSDRVRKVGFSLENYESLEDVTIPIFVSGTATGLPLPPSPDSTNPLYFSGRIETAGRGVNQFGGSTTGANRTTNPGLVWNGTTYVAQTLGPNLCIGSYFPFHYNLIVIGGEAAGRYPFEGYFFEFLNYNRLLTDEESSSVRNYLQKKWFP